MGTHIELARRQYSGNEHQVICFILAVKLVGLGIVNCIYFNQGMNNYGLYIMQFIPDTDKKIKIKKCLINDIKWL